MFGVFCVTDLHSHGQDDQQTCGCERRGVIHGLTSCVDRWRFPNSGESGYGIRHSECDVRYGQIV